MDQNQNQYDRKQNEDPFQQDLWNDYMESLDENKEEEEQQSGLSDKVEQDLYNYSRQNNSKKKVGAVLLATMGIIVLTVGAIGGAYAFSHTDSDEVYDDDDYVEPYTYDYDDENDVYSMLGRGFRTPEFVFNDHYYKLPVTFSDFNLDEYTIKKDAFSNEITEVGAEPVRIVLQNEWGDADTVLLVVSPDGSTVPLSESVIIGISSTSYNLTISDWYSPGSSEYYFLEDLEEYGYDVSTYTYSDSEEYRIVNGAPEGSGYEYYNLSFQTHGGRVQDITLLLSQEDLH